MNSSFTFLRWSRQKDLTSLGAFSKWFPVKLFYVDFQRWIIAFTILAETMEHVKATMTTTPVIAADHIEECTVKVKIYLLHIFSILEISGQGKVIPLCLNRRKLSERNFLALTTSRGLQGGERTKTTT